MNKQKVNYRHINFANSDGVPIKSSYISNVYFARIEEAKDLIKKPNMLFGRKKTAYVPAKKEEFIVDTGVDIYA